MALGSSGRPTWFSALSTFVEGEAEVQLRTPIRLRSGATVERIPSLFLRFPKWTGEPFVDDFGKKSAAMIVVHGEHVMAEIAVLRLLEVEGWRGRWINTYNGHGDVWKYLTDWRDVSRRDQVSRPIQENEPRALLSAIAAAHPARYAGCWDTFAWRGEDYVFLECKRQTPKYTDTVRPEQESWLRAALQLCDARLAPASFCLIQWDYQGGE